MSLSDDFQKDVELRSPLRFLLREPGLGERSYESDLPFALVGKAAAALISPVQRCPRRLYYFQYLNGRMFGMPLCRAQAFPAAALLPSGWLNPSIQLTWQESRLECAVASVAADSSGGVDPREDRVADAGALPGIAAEILVDGVTIAHWRMNRRVAVAGRSPDATAQLAHPSVSWCHCSFVSTPGGVWVVDLLSRTGIQLNGHQVAFAKVRPGDTLQIGDFEFHLKPLDGVAEGASSSVLAKPVLPSSSLVRNGDLPATRTVDPDAILPIVQQFGLIHQQMMDQFQQTMLMTVQMFGKLHSEQLGLIREELDHLMRLTRELEQARHELAQQRQSAPAGLPTPSSTVAKSPLPPAQPVAPAPENQRSEQTSRKGAAADVEDWLTERIASLEQQRQSLWQRLLSSLTG